MRAMAKACHGIYHGDETQLDTEVVSITTDSRKADQGCLFVAIQGAKSDGHDFINDCFEKGALCVISERELTDAKGAYIQVLSSLQALKDLAGLYRGNLDIKVVGITGSVGKTSTKETIGAVLGERYRVLKTEGNFNNEIGLPLTIFRLTEEDEIAVLEMGISDFGEMERLAGIARPDVCVITNIGLCHLENLKSRDGILKAKTEMFLHMNPNGTVILNGDDDKLFTVQEVCGKRPVFFGMHAKDGVYADAVENLGLAGTRFVVHGLPAADDVDTFEIFVPVPGEHMIYNALAAACVGSLFGLRSDEIAAGIAKLKTIAGRSNIIKTQKYTIIDDSYNANPVSMKASIDVMDTAKGRKVCILGDMFELGENEKSLHYDVGQYLAKKHIDVLIAIGKLAEQIAFGAMDYMDQHHDAYPCKVFIFENKKKFLDNIGQMIYKDDNILVKASHGMAFNELVELLQNN